MVLNVIGVISLSNSWRRTLIGHGWGMESRTGHPVMMVIIEMVIMEGQATAAFVIKDPQKGMVDVACIFLTYRNNEMINLIAKYFL